MRALLPILFSLLCTAGFSQSFEVYISSRGENAVKRYDMDGNYLGFFVEPSAGGLSTTEDILFHPDGSVLVTGFGNTAIKRYDGITGAFLGDFSMGFTLNGPSKLSIGPDSLIYVTQWGGVVNNIVRFDLDGNFMDEFTTDGVANALGHVWDADGNMYVAAYGTGSDGVVKKFDPDGNDLGDFVNSDFLQGPTSIWFNANGHLFVEDWITGSILEYSSAGAYLGVFNSGSMSNPEGLALTEDGILLIGDWGQDKIHMLDTLGGYLGTFASGDGLTDPNSVKIRQVEDIDTTTTHLHEMLAQSFSVTPSIGSGPFQISWQGDAQVILQMLDLSGRLVTERLVNGLESIEWMPESTLPEGMYLINLSLNGIPYSTKKIFITH